jgi:hypothetical protein
MVEELSLRAAPEGFDDEFFEWLDEMSDVLMVTFVAAGGIPASEVAGLEAKLRRRMPADLRRFYARYNPWVPLPNWHWWEETEEMIREAIGLEDAPLAPVSCANYGATGGYDSVAVLRDADRYEIVERKKATGHLTWFPDLRAYFIDGVRFEGGNP